MNYWVLIIVFAYLLLVFGIGIYSSKKIRNTSDYLLAGRHLGPFLLAGTLAATSIDGVSTLGVVANTYGSWGASAIWYSLSMGVAFFLLCFLAPKLRSTEVKTVPEYFCVRYGRTAGLLSSGLTIVSMVGLTAGQLKVSASILEVMLGMDYNTALLLVAVAIAVYSMLGGLRGVALTDWLQLVLIVVGMCVAIPYTLRLAGGWDVVVANLPVKTLSLTAGIKGWGEIFGYMLLFFTAFAVGEEVIPCYYAAKDKKTARQGSWLAGIALCLFAAIPVALGLIILALYHMDVMSVGVINALEQSGRYALPALALVSMPPAVVGVLFAGLLSATMSSADSSLLGAGSVYSNDIYREFINSEADTHRLVAVTRVAMVFVMIFSFMTAVYADNILGLTIFSLALRAAGGFFPYVMGHLWKGASRAGCLISLVAGTAAYLITEQQIVYIPNLNSILPALAMSAVCFFLFSWLLPDGNGSGRNG